MKLRSVRYGALLLASMGLGLPTNKAWAQTAPSSNPASLGPLKDGWEEIDQWFMFLTVELSSAEASINSIDKALVLAGYQRHLSQEKSDNFAAGNSLMDRRGGGPVAWQDFYGKAAMNFYYHASETIDVKDPPFVGHEEWNGKTLTKVDRPPQFDFIYRANADAKGRADAETAMLGTRIDQLLARRRQLEAEQSALWFKIALRKLEPHAAAVSASSDFSMFFKRPPAST